MAETKLPRDSQQVAEMLEKQAAEEQRVLKMLKEVKTTLRTIPAEIKISSPEPRSRPEWKLSS